MSRIVPLTLLALMAAACNYDTHGTASPSADDLAAIPTDAGVVEDPAEPTEPPPEPTGEAPGSGDAGEDALTHDDPAVMAAVDAWRARHAEQGDLASLDAGRCIRTVTGLRIMVPGPEEFFRLCKRCNLSDDSPHCERVGRANGCAPWHGVYDAEDERVHALIVLDDTKAAELVTRDRLVIHETIHHLARCSDHPEDRTHEYEHLWCTDDPSCVNARARARLGI